MIILTNACISSYTKTLELVKKNYKKEKDDPIQNRVFVLGIGDGVSKSLCDELAQVGGGKSAFVLDSAGIQDGVNQLLGYASRQAGL